MTHASRNDELLAALGFPTLASPASDPKWQLLALLRENTYRPLLASDEGKSLRGSLLATLGPDGSIASFSIAQVDVLKVTESPAGSVRLECVAWLPAGIPVEVSADASSLRLSALAD